MNHKIKIRFRIVKNSHVIEVLLDERLSFKENLEAISEICEEEVLNAEVYDPMKKIFLDTGVPLKAFSFHYFVSLYLFT
ncbi:MAG: hypothetical protein IJI44_08850 [Erysipelotrichaceae bacterium]|nr:hypothetical protein [Erysipelotrichaceae bacterium]